MVAPEFKVGDKVISRYSRGIVTITSIESFPDLTYYKLHFIKDGRPDWGWSMYYSISSKLHQALE